MTGKKYALTASPKYQVLGKVWQAIPTIFNQKTEMTMCLQNLGILNPNVNNNYI